MTDEPGLQSLFDGLSDDSSYQRFLCHKSHSRQEIARLTDTHDDRHAVLVATCNANGEDLVAVAGYDVDQATGLAEVAFAVRDDWQGRGVGTALFQRLLELAKSRGVRGFTADTLVTNGRMQAIFAASGLKVERRLDAGVYHLEVTFG